MWRAIDAQYAYFEGRRTAWKRARETWRPRAVRARSRDEFVESVEGALASLHDDHVSVSPRSPRSPRRVPEETDLWARWKEGRAVIESVRFAGDADVAGVHPGDVVTHVDGVPVDRAAVRLLAPMKRPTAAERDWALRHVLAGPRDGTLVIDLGGRETRRVQIERSSKPPAPVPSLIARRIGELRDLGYIRLRNLSDPRLPEQLDGALASIADVRASILDLRDATEGDRDMTRAVLARRFKGPVLVLVDRWTGGETEALAAALVETASAKLVGTPMAGLRGELRTLRLPHSGIEVRFPAKRAFLRDGTPRESLRPHVEVDPAAPHGGPGDPILYQAIKLGSYPN